MVLELTRVLLGGRDDLRGGDLERSLPQQSVALGLGVGADSLGLAQLGLGP